MIAAAKLNVEPSNCIVFEDAQAGIQAANSAGMISIGIGDKDNLKEADYVFADFTQIELNFLEQLLKK